MILEQPELPLWSKRRMLVLLGVLLFGSFLVTSTISFLVSRNSIRRSILQDDLPLTSDNIYSEIQRDLFEPILISSSMANDTLLKAWIHEGEQPLDAVTKYLGATQTRYGTITSFLVSEKTRNYYHPNGILKTVKEGDPVDAWFFRVRDMKKPYEINVDPDLANKNAMTIFINYRMVDADGTFLAATGVGLTVNSVKRLMQDYQARFGRNIYFYNHKGELLLHSLGTDVDHPLTEHAGHEVFHDLLRAVGDGHPEANKSHTSEAGEMINYRYIPELDWILVVEQAADGTHPILIQTFGFNLMVCLLTSALLLSVIRLTLIRYQLRLETRNRLLQEKNSEILRQSQELQSANDKLDAMHREKDEFIGITAHDLKGPLTSVLGSVSLLMEDTKIDGDARELVTYIQLSSQNMLSEVETLLSLTELESPAELELSPVDATAMTHAVVRAHEVISGAKRIQIKQEMTEHPVHLIANQRWLAGVIANLVSNAVKYGPIGSEVIVAVQEKGKEVEIAVQDRGCGISQEEQARLFEKYSRLSSKPTAGESSTGLGLFIVKHMTERMGGRVWFESALGKGSTFAVVFPAYAEGD